MDVDLRGDEDDDEMDLGMILITASTGIIKVKLRWRVLADRTYTKASHWEVQRRT